MKKLMYRCLPIIALMVMGSCQKELELKQTEIGVETALPQVIQFGEPLNIPYTAENMDKALEQVIAHLDASAPYGKS